MARCPGCWYQVLTIIAMIKAVIARLIFAVHSFIAIWRVTDVKQNPTYWCLALALMILIMEGVLTLWKKRGAEWKWFSPVVFLYLCSVVPAIWFLELDLLQKRIANRDLSIITNNATTPKLMYNSAKSRQTIRGLALVLPVAITDDEWAKILEQLLLLFLIVGRWLLPKGDITRDQLSQLLLVNIGMAADIIELFEAFNETQVRHNWTLTVVIMSLWTGSLFQFTMVVTATKARKPRVAMTKPKEVHRMSCVCCETEIWAIVTSIILQDGPFLVLRMLLILRYEVMSYMNVFFTCKNSLVMLLQLYRILVVLVETRRKKRKEKFQEDTEILALTRFPQQKRLARQTNTVLPRLSPTKNPIIPKDAPYKQYMDQTTPKPKLREAYPLKDRFLTDEQQRRLSLDPIPYICSADDTFDTQSIVSYYSLVGLKTRPYGSSLPQNTGLLMPQRHDNLYGSNCVTSPVKVKPKVSFRDNEPKVRFETLPKAPLVSEEDLSMCSSIMLEQVTTS